MISKGLIFMMTTLVCSTGLIAEVYIPENFRNGELLTQVILISDVDGVIRDSTEVAADPRILEEVKSLLSYPGIDVTFISGTPIDNDPNLEIWRKGNLPLNKVFGSTFSQEVAENRVTIFGVLGGHKMQEDGSLEVVDEYPPETIWDLSKLLIHGFLREVLQGGSVSQQALAKHLQAELEKLTASDLHSSNITPQEFFPIIDPIRQHLDPKFKLISNGALIETQTSTPPWNTAFSAEWIKNAMNEPDSALFSFPLSQKKMATGLVKRDETEQFHFLMISKTNKGITTKAHIEEKLKQLPNALVITIGDTQVDFPMHHNAHLAFHVGLKTVWKNNALAKCIMIRDPQGRDRQHVEGTLKILSLLKEAIGRSFYDFKYIPKQDASGTWNYYSLSQLELEPLSTPLFNP